MGVTYKSIKNNTMKHSPISPKGEQPNGHVGSIVTGIALLVGWSVVAVSYQVQHINELAETNAPLAAEQLVWLTKIVAFGFTLGVLVTGAWTIWLGHRTCRADRFPPRGVKLVGHMQCQTGRRAKVIGWTTQFVGLLILVLGTSVSWIFVQLAQFLIRH